MVSLSLNEPKISSPGYKQRIAVNQFLVIFQLAFFNLIHHPALNAHFDHAGCREQGIRVDVSRFSRFQILYIDAHLAVKAFYGILQLSG